ncbi:MAG: hypothetical protein HKN31_00070 [Pricia sp.]|nr:hypothetical protein [Pricia sp.]
MDKSEKLEKYFNEEHQFKDAIAILRSLALKTDLKESFKWSFPTYTIDNKNVLAICKFKNHFGLWFFNGVFLEDEKNVLENAQEGKTQAMRQWKFFSEDEIDTLAVSAYISEAIENQKKGIELRPNRKKKTETFQLPELLKKSLAKNPDLKKAFNELSPYKREEYSKYIAEAKQDKTKLSRLQKISPMIRNGKGLNDKYR